MMAAEYLSQWLNSIMIIAVINHYDTPWCGFTSSAERTDLQKFLYYDIKLSGVVLLKRMSLMRTSLTD